VKSKFRKENQFRLHGESYMDKCGEMKTNRSQICFLCLGEWKKSVSWRRKESMCFCKGGNGEEMGLWGTLSEIVWKVKKKLNSQN